MNENDIEITLDNDNENIDIDREDSIYTNISEEEINEIKSRIETNEDDISDIKAEQITQNTNITSNTNRITVLESQSGNKVALSINSNYVMTLQLLNKNNEVLSTGTIDLPIESMVVNASYSNGILTLTLQNGQTLNVDISDIVSGLVSETTFNTAINGLQSSITALQGRMTTAETNINNKVDKVTGKGLSTNDYTTEDKNKLASLENYDDTQVKADIEENAADIATLNDEQDTQDAAIQQNAADILALEAKHDEEVAELQAYITELEEKNQALEDQIPIDTAEPGSDITVNDSARYEFKKFEIEGESEQETFTGKNKLKLLLSEQVTQDGITYTPNEDGSVTISGTRGSNGKGPIFAQISITENQDFYIMCINKNTNLPESISVQLYGNFEQYREISFNKSYNFPITGTYNVAIKGATTGANINGTYFFMLVSSYDSAYEPYVGGQPAPNPDYECPIHNVTGDVDVKVENKNLFDKNTQITNGWYNDNGELIDSSLTAHFVNNIKVKTNTQYTISGYLIINLPNINYANFSRIYFFDANQNFISRTPSITTNNYTFNTPQNCEYINFQLYNDNNYSNYKYSQSLNTFQLEEGSVTDYVPHEEQTAIFPLEEGQILHEGDTIEDKIVQRRYTVILDGTENVSKGASSLARYNYYLVDKTLSEVPKDMEDYSNSLLCSHFTGMSRSANSFINNGIAISANLNRFVISCDNITTAEDFKAFLAQQYANGTPVTVEYELAEPLETEFTEAQVTAKAQIDKLYSYKGTTYITSEANLNVTYRKDQDLENQNLQSQIDELKARVSLLE